MSDYEKYPELYAQDRQIDPQTRQRTVPMKVLNLSMIRTGTTSIQRALEILGIQPVAHGFTIFTQSHDLLMWQRGLRTKYWPTPNTAPFDRQEFDNLLGQYEGLSDWPCIAFSQELIAAYPEAKVILVEREIESWYKSFTTTATNNVFWDVFYYIAMLDYYHLGQFQIMTRLLVKGWFKAENQVEFEANAKRVYREHYQNVKVWTPKEKLLVFGLQEGWEPLCRFLDVPVPDVPFPRINDSEELQRRINVSLKISMMRVLKKAALVVGAVGSASVAWWMRKS
ncbi:uncharacterized protein LY89DRAFT_458555 [Mollisia scopiformis]|uniref:P-loop containing nucleoside triphosphate hydrolase protein n=1 Tax=Mollisia scopiformis TaxID=149040 RepID=A0A194XHW6_MOLSC|nr:uncharacterized protein LY89DRAFT_458555 [Mollisia scopiformis]KUJ19719.1 hypothetical protein LY89DRAFT_458555 [Mollisia scopiformis]